jgi:hypothetical protein
MVLIKDVEFCRMAHLIFQLNCLISYAFEYQEVRDYGVFMAGKW